MRDEEIQQHHERAKKLISEQNFRAAMITGAVATVLAAFVYSFVVSRWPFSYGFALVGIGIFVGFFIGFLGRGVATRFAVGAAAYTIIGCVLGSMLLVMIELQQPGSTSPLEVLQNYSLAEILDRTLSYISFGSLIYWFIAVIAAAFLARRSLSRSDRLALGLHESNG